jgi:predicted chitinase
LHLEGLNQAFDTFQINTCLRKAHFLAQILHESGHLALTRESGSLAYLQAKPYSPYIGRGLMQLTGRENYRAYSTSVGEDCHSTNTNREKLERPPHAAKSAGHFWKNMAKLNDEADANDFLSIMPQINGGFNGFDERLSILKRAFQIFGINESTEFIFSQSAIYNDNKKSLAWGIWNDPIIQPFAGNIIGITKNITNAKDGYRRTLELRNLSDTDQDKFNIHHHPELSGYKSFTGHINIYQFATRRLSEL